MIDLMATRLCHVSLMRYLWDIYIVCSITSYIEKSTHTLHPQTTTKFAMFPQTKDYINVTPNCKKIAMYLKY
jgi:hypothetical protein